MYKVKLWIWASFKLFDRGWISQLRLISLTYCQCLKICQFIYLYSYVQSTYLNKFGVRSRPVLFLEIFDCLGDMGEFLTIFKCSRYFDIDQGHSYSAHSTQLLLLVNYGSQFGLNLTRNGSITFSWNMSLMGPQWA